jgi:V/A-type H+-transporting ATPase subunit E
MQELRMHGMVLNNIDVVSAMENACDGFFIPASLDKNGALKGNVISLDALSALKERVNKSIRNMAEELQSLLDKINAEGVRKAEAEAARIIENAKKQAQDIRNEAEAEAAATMKNAADQAAALESRAEAAIKQAARDVLLQLQSELQNRIEKAVSGAAEQALTAEFMTELIRSMAARFAAEHPAAWIARWRDAVQQAAKGSFYPALAAEAERLVASV